MSNNGSRQIHARSETSCWPDPVSAVQKKAMVQAHAKVVRERRKCTPGTGSRALHIKAGIMRPLTLSPAPYPEPCCRQRPDPERPSIILLSLPHPHLILDATVAGSVLHRRDLLLKVLYVVRLIQDVLAVIPAVQCIHV